MTYVNEKQLMHLVGPCGLDRGALPFSWRAVLPIPAPSSLTAPYFARGTASCNAAEQAETRLR